MGPELRREGLKPRGPGPMGGMWGGRGQAQVGKVPACDWLKACQVGRSH